MIPQLYRVLDDDGRRLLRRMLTGLVVGAVLQGVAFVLLVPVLRAVLSPQPGRAWPWLALLAGVFAAYAVCHWDSIMAGYRVGTGVSRTLHHRLGDHIGTLPLGWFTPERAGRLAQITGKNVVDIMGAPAHLLRPVVNGMVTPLVVVVGLTALDWRLGLAVLLTVPLTVLAYRWTSRRVAVFDEQLDEAVVEAGGRVIEFAQTQPELRAFRRTTDGHRILDDALVAQHRAGRRLLLSAVPAFVAFIAIVQVAFTVAILVGTTLVLGGSLGVPELLALLVLVARFVEPLVAAADLGAAMRMARNALDRVESVLATPGLPEAASPAAPRPGAGIELDRVTFGYAPGAPVLEEVSFTVPPRTLTAIVGPSGSGKTTLLRLVARFFDVEGGTVRHGGVDVRDLAVDDLMRGVSLVFQDVYLFDATIAENIRLARPEATDAELAEVAQLARVDEIVERLPLGWETRVGEGGATLSGGERQRVSIARALLKDAPLVLLDEATAALDPENEAAVQAALAVLSRDRTVVVVAHRLQTVAEADQILVLDAGRIVERGRHAELLAHGGRYAAFWHERTAARGWRLSTSPDALATAGATPRSETS